jgi:hypothetical protein
VERKKEKQINNSNKSKMKGKRKIGRNMRKVTLSLSCIYIYIYVYLFRERPSAKCDLCGSESITIITNIKFYIQFNWVVGESFSFCERFALCVRTFMP